VKRGVVERDEDVSGVTGNGRVATFAVNNDGRTAIFWPEGVGLWPSLEAAIKVHGHGGKTRFVILDDEMAETSHCEHCHAKGLIELGHYCPKHDFGCPGCLAEVKQ
jgi:hypothetical protein